MIWITVELEHDVKHCIIVIKMFLKWIDETLGPRILSFFKDQSSDAFQNIKAWLLKK